MRPTTVTSTSFIGSPNRVMKAAEQGTVIVTKRGEPEIVLMSYKAYLALTVGQGSFLERIGMPGLSDVELDTSLPRELATTKTEYESRAKTPAAN